MKSNGEVNPIVSCLELELLGLYRVVGEGGQVGDGDGKTEAWMRKDWHHSSLDDEDIQ